MPRPMSIFRVETPKKEKHSFEAIRGGVLAYHNYGSLKTYSNRTQADKKVQELKELGYNCFVRYSWPFIIIKAD